MSTDRVAAAIESEVAARGVAGVAAAIVEDRAIAWTGAFGARRSGGEPVTTDTVFEVASVSKPVFAWRVLELCDSGVLDLDAPLTGYTTERFIEDEGLERVTARMVLTHTAGLSWKITGPNYEGHPQLDGAPGGDFEYSGVSFDYLAWVVERIVGQPTAEMMREFMSSLGMTRSSYVWEESFESDYASPHDLDGNVLEKDKSATFGPGSVGSMLHSTVNDMAAFLCQLVATDVSPARALALRPHVEVHQEYLHGPPAAGAHWGLGIGVWTIDGETTVWHWGENPGFQCFVIAWPGRGSGIVVLTNSDHGHWVSKAAATAFSGREHPAFRWIEN
jgi:CubicO group peptidase (beta-lactamase class C family)